MSDLAGDIDEATYGQVGRLLGAERAAEMLELLRGTLTGLAGLPDDALIAPAGLAAAHRLKSEAGLMGFARVARACEIFDAAGASKAVDRSDLDELRGAMASALRIIGTLAGPSPRTAP